MSWWEKKMTPRTRHMLAGGAIGAIGLLAIYEIFRPGSAIAAPVSLPPHMQAPQKHEHKHKHHKHRHHEHHNERGHYGRHDRHGHDD